MTILKKTMVICLWLITAWMGCSAATPKLVVGVVVDQMRWDYLSRYSGRWGDSGLNRLMNEGYACNNCLINYLPTVTSIGHTSAYTGSTPAYHGICGNTFYIDDKRVGCVRDNSVNTVGSDTRKGQSSPHYLLATTIGDQLRLHTDFQSKVIGVSYKDRAAILPAGRSANAAYWFDNEALRFVSSTYYMKELPDYANEVNTRLATNKELKKTGSNISLSTLCGHLITDMAIAALKGEKLGQGKVTDMLCVSYSQTDAIGHEWSTRGERTDKAYEELDKDISRLLSALDEQVGRGNYLLFLTADHGAAHNWKYMQDHKLKGGKWLFEEAIKGAEACVAKELHNSKPVINDILDYRVFLNHHAIEEQGLDLEHVKAIVIRYLRTYPHVIHAVDTEKLRTSSLPPLLMDRALMGYHPHRSGDIYVIIEPGYYNFGQGSSPVGTTHGAWNPYDAHIPLLFYGWGIQHGATSREVHITDIAPTICQMLHIQQPNACVGEAITEITK